MKGKKALTIVILLTAAIACSEQSKNDSAPIEEDLKTLRYLKEVEWPKAYREQDTVLLDRILGEDFQLVDQSGGWYTKADELAWIKEHSTSYDSFFYEINRFARLFKDKQFWPGSENSNSSGFSARPSGYGNTEHPNNFRNSAILWSSSKEDEHFIWTFILEDDKDSIRKASQHPEYAFSVRCIKRK